MADLGKGKRIKHRANREYPRPSSQSQAPQKKKRTVSPPSREYNHPWFSSEAQERIFNESFANKEIIPPKVLNTNWLANQGFQFQELLVEQGLQQFVSLKGSYYPELVRVFYSNLRKNNDAILVSEVKGVEIILTDTVFGVLGGLRRIGVAPKFSSLKTEGFEIQKEPFYASMMRNSSTWEADVSSKKKSKKKITYNTGGLQIEDRLLHYAICWVVAARGSNHAQVSEEDLAMLAALKNNIRIDWVHVVEDIMLKTRRLMDYKCPYALFVSRVLEHFKVPVDGEVREFSREIHELNERVLKMMKLKKTDAGWIPREDAQINEAGPSDAPADDAPAGDAPPAEEEELKPLSTFERAVLAKLDDIREAQRRDYKELKDCFEAISERLDAMNIPYPEDL